MIRVASGDQGTSCLGSRTCPVARTPALASPLFHKPHPFPHPSPYWLMSCCTTWTAHRPSPCFCMGAQALTHQPHSAHQARLAILSFTFTLLANVHLPCPLHSCVHRSRRPSRCSRTRPMAPLSTHTRLVHPIPTAPMSTQHRGLTPGPTLLGAAPQSCRWATRARAHSQLQWPDGFVACFRAGACLLHMPCSAAAFGRLAPEQLSQPPAMCCLLARAVALTHTYFSCTCACTRLQGMPVTGIPVGGPPPPIPMLYYYPQGTQDSTTAASQPPPAGTDSAAGPTMTPAGATQQQQQQAQAQQPGPATSSLAAAYSKTG